MKPKAASFPHLLLKKGKIKEQCYESLKTLILEGKLKPGTKLPSSRALSEMMSISRNSVISGFDRLTDEGYLFTKRGSGTYVSSVIPDEMTKIKIISQHHKVTENKSGDMINPQLKAILSTWDKISPQALQNKIFSVGVGCTDLFPHDLWGKLLGRTWRQFRNQIGQHNDPLGFLPLRLAISDYIRTTRGVNCTENQVLIVSGTQQAMNLASQVLLQHGDEVWLDEPGYDGAYGAFTATGANVCPVITDSYGMDISYGIKHWPNAKMVFTTPSHQFPLGGVLSLARRITLLEWAAENNRWIFEDDYNSEFRYCAPPMQALQGLDRQQRVIYAGTFSKMMFPELRLGFLIIPNQLIEAFKLAKYYADTRTSYLEQATLAAFIIEGHYARHVRRIRKACYERQQALIEAIGQYLPDSIRVEPSDSGIHLVCWLPDNLKEREIIARCREIGLGAQPLSRYRQKSSNKQAILLGFAAHPPSELIAGIKKLATIINASATKPPSNQVIHKL